MSRRLERVWAGIAVNGVTSFLTAPASHKLEVLQVNVVCTDATGIVDLHLRIGGATYVPQDRFAFAGHPAVWARQYAGLVFYPGEECVLSSTVAGGTFLLATIDYIDVDFT